MTGGDGATVGFVFVFGVEATLAGAVCAASGAVPDVAVPVASFDAGASTGAGAAAGSLAGGSAGAGDGGGDGVVADESDGGGGV